MNLYGFSQTEEIKIPDVPYFCHLNTVRPQPNLAVPNLRHTLSLLFEHYKIPAVSSRT